MKNLVQKSYCLSSYGLVSPFWYYLLGWILMINRVNAAQHRCVNPPLHPCACGGCCTLSMLVACYLGWPRVTLLLSPLLKECTTWCTQRLGRSFMPRLGEEGGWSGWIGLRAPANNSPRADSAEAVWHMYPTNHRALQQRKEQWPKGIQ